VTNLGKTAFRIGFVGFAAFVSFRLVVAVMNYQELDRGLGVSSFDLLVLSVLIIVVVIYLVFRSIMWRLKRALASVRSWHQVGLALPAMLREEEASELRNFGIPCNVRKTIGVIVLLQEDRCVWISTGRNRRIISETGSAHKVEYSVGRYDHFGRSYDALIVRITSISKEISVPIPIYQERRVLPQFRTKMQLEEVLSSIPRASIS
jgi:hypothetical protein